MLLKMLLILLSVYISVSLENPKNQNFEIVANTSEAST